MLVETYITKYEIADLDLLKGILDGACDLANDANKILEIYVSYHNKTKTELEFLCIVKNIHKDLNAYFYKRHKHLL